MTNNLANLIAANDALKAEIAERIAKTARTESVAKISEENPNPVLRVTRQGEVLYANQSAGGLLAHWVVDACVRVPKEWRTVIDDAAKGNDAADHELRCAGKVYSLTVQPVAGADYINIYGRDITSVKEAEDQIVNYDDLTGLPNRALFQDRLQQVLNHARAAENWRQFT